MKLKYTLIRGIRLIRFRIGIIGEPFTESPGSISLGVSRKANWNDNILRRNCLLPDAIEEQMTEVKWVGRRRTQLLDDLRNRRRYWELKEKAEDRKSWKLVFINRT